MKLKALIVSLMLCMAGAGSPVCAQTRGAVIEGTLRMYYLNNEGDCDVISQYRKADGENTYLAFVVELDKKRNVSSLLDEREREWLDDPYHSAIMIVPNFKYQPKDFAAKYANKRVRAKGSLYVPGGGWRNATEVVMDLKEIKRVDSIRKNGPL